MCYNCGCSVPQDDMGNPNNITDETFSRVGDILGKSELETKELVFKYLSGEEVDEQAKASFDEMFLLASTAWGQQIEEAKKETRKLLSATLKK